jgi:hypothetical protein
MQAVVVRGIVLMLGMTLVASGVGGCAAAGVVANAFPQYEQAEYVPRHEPMLVLCENYRDPGATYVDADQLEQFLAHELTAHDVAPVVGADKLADLRGARPGEFAKMSVTDVGRAVGASQVLYVSMERSGVYVAEASEMLKGSAAARVKLIDVASGATLWPSDAPDGRFVGVESPMVHTSETVTAASVRTGLQRALADKIAKFFYKYEKQ